MPKNWTFFMAQHRVNTAEVSQMVVEEVKKTRFSAN